MDDDYDEYDAESAPLSPASSDGESSCSSDEEGSLASSCSSIEDLEEDDFLEDIPEAKTPPPQAPGIGEPAIYEAEEQQPRMVPFHAPPPPPPPEYFHSQPHHPYPVAAPVAVPEPVHTMPVAVHPTTCAPKFQLHQYVWDMLRYGQPTPPMPFHHQVPLFAHMQGCY